ncbi:MAG: DNA polymerase III subunit gamma/tau [Bdellovibrio bacteriovorus]
MTYQVLARKWRPRAFADMVGQQHVVRALGNALDRDQLHHAYLFTGTRGVGKTTLARILAKALNCEQGVSSTPCGQCGACLEIDGGRFVDLLEVDAASRTKVDQTRELLENVPYAPVRGRYKVYLIDEVHMFSGHSFNALLKTLEEPPPHVKFLLATTDPQKVPVTVLSRCLQLNLRRLLPEEIRDRLSQVLEIEGLDHEPAALGLLARAADGSMRDGLSLLDQAIAFGGGRVTEAEVRAMLGSLSGDLSFGLIAALAEGDAPGLLAEVERIASLTPDFGELLKELIGLLHRIALFQQVPGLIPADDPDRERITALAQRLAPEDLQLYYQIALTGQQDLPLAPDPRMGFEMVLLRALAFRPADRGRPRQETASAGAPSTRPGHDIPPGQPTGALDQNPASTPRAAAEASAPPRLVDGAPGFAKGGAGPASGGDPTPRGLASAADWHRLVERLQLGGVASQLARNCTLLAWNERHLTLALDPAAEQLRSRGTEQRLREALERALGGSVQLEIQVAHPQQETPAQRRAREGEERQRRAQETMDHDPVVLGLKEQLDAQWVPGSVQPTD